MDTPSPLIASGSWLHHNIRPLLAVVLTSTVGGMALYGHPEAQHAIIAAFPMLVAALWAERSALKRPGIDS